MTLSQAFALANDSEFRTLVSFGGPPRPGRITALEPSGQVRVEMDDPDGGDALAWPLDGAVYAVDDVVYCLFAANAPDSAVVVGAKGSAPAYDPLRASEVRAVDANGLRFTDDAGNLGVVVADGGRVGVGGAAEPTRQLAVKSSGQASMLMQTTDDTASSFAAALVATNGNDVEGQILAHDTLRTAARCGITLGGWVEILAGGANLQGILINTFAADPIVFGTANVERMRIAADGKVGIGTSSPRGIMHAHDGICGLLAWSYAAVGPSAIPIIPDGAGDVTSRVLLFYIVDNAGASIAGMAHVAAGGTQDVVAGTGTWRFRVQANGLFDVWRSAGTGTAKVAVLALWV